MGTKVNWTSKDFEIEHKKTGILLESRNISLQLISHDTKVNFKLKASRCKCISASWSVQVYVVDKKGTWENDFQLVQDRVSLQKDLSPLLVFFIWPLLNIC